MSRARWQPIPDLSSARSRKPRRTSSDSGRSARSVLETVLLAEDEAGVRTLAETVLKKLGYKVLVGRDGRREPRLRSGANGAGVD